MKYSIKKRDACNSRDTYNTLVI
jgi:hypothetical protein